MSKLRKKSYNRLKLPTIDQETMVTCNYCRGSGRVVLQDDGRIYRTKMCPFCIGSGAVTREMFRACQRWMKILAYYKSKGLTS